VLVSIAVKKHRSGFVADNIYSPCKRRVDSPLIIQNEDTVATANVDGARKSVHYNFADPYHPLRMHPVESLGTIKVVPPEMTDGKAEAAENEDPNPNLRVVTSPAVYRPLPPRAAYLQPYCESSNSINLMA
jgi:hypothetical protein